jgi:hypothetical protein
MMTLAVATYIKSRNIFIGYAVLLVLDIAAVAVHIMFWLSMPILIAVGLGVWAIEHNFA